MKKEICKSIRMKSSKMLVNITFGSILSVVIWIELIWKEIPAPWLWPCLDTDLAVLVAVFKTGFNSHKTKSVTIATLSLKISDFLRYNISNKINLMFSRSYTCGSQIKAKYIDFRCTQISLLFYITYISIFKIEDSRNCRLSWKIFKIYKKIFSLCNFYFEHSSIVIIITELKLKKSFSNFCKSWY